MSDISKINKENKFKKMMIKWIERSQQRLNEKWQFTNITKEKFTKTMAHPKQIQSQKHINTPDERKQIVRLSSQTVKIK
jgi:hypothetical protein